jgi:hypothetical protein
MIVTFEVTQNNLDSFKENIVDKVFFSIEPLLSNDIRFVEESVVQSANVFEKGEIH